MTSMDETSNALATTSISTNRKRNQRQPRSKPHNNDSTTYKKKIVCNFCHKTGHIAKYCFARKKASKITDKNKDNKSDDSKHDGSTNSTAFVVHDDKTIDKEVAIFSELDERHVCVLDSGASRHLCCQKEWFTDLLPCNNEYVYLGDGRT